MRLLAAALLLAAAPARAGWSLEWHDEFDGPAGAPVDPLKWTYNAGGGGWGNDESEVYCAPGAPAPCRDDRPSSALDGQGHLVIEAVRVSTHVWTSARLKTDGRAAFTEGRIEARLKLPTGAGLWPAFWLLGQSPEQWPDRGEIDVMENVPTSARHGGLGPYKVRSTVHGPGYSGDHGVGQDVRLPAGGRVDDGFHVYGVIREKGRLRFYVDDWTRPFLTLTPADLPKGKAWALDGPFFIILNLAVEGGWPGDADAQTPDPARVLADWVRVYKAT